jgi:hypothetical protein
LALTISEAKYLAITGNVAFVPPLNPPLHQALRNLILAAVPPVLTTSSQAGYHAGLRPLRQQQPFLLQRNTR